MKIRHPVVCELQRFDRGFLAGCGRPLDLGGADPEPEFCHVDAIEPERQVGERLIAARAHVGDDDGDRCVDVGRRLALGGEQRREALLEIRRLHIERDRHG